ALAAIKMCIKRKHMSYNRYKTTGDSQKRVYLPIRYQCHGAGTYMIRNLANPVSTYKTFEDVNKQHSHPGRPAQQPECVGGPCISAPMIADIHSFHHFSNPYRGWDRAYQITQQYNNSKCKHKYRFIKSSDSLLQKRSVGIAEPANKNGRNRLYVSLGMVRRAHQRSTFHMFDTQVFANLFILCKLIGVHPFFNGLVHFCRMHILSNRSCIYFMFNSFLNQFNYLLLFFLKAYHNTGFSTHPLIFAALQQFYGTLIFCLRTISPVKFRYGVQIMAQHIGCAVNDNLQ